MARAGGAVWDEMTDARGQVRPHWQILGQQLQRWSSGERRALSSASARMIAGLGTTYNVYSDVGSTGQPYELDPVPLLIAPSEWSHVAAGLAQRMRLIETVLADLYGPQRLLKEGLIPPDLVHASPAFLPYARGVQPTGGRFMITAGCDLVRLASGQWNVIRDHTSAPGGLGQVLGNRNVTSKLLSEPFDDLHIARLGAFFELERSTLQSLTPSRGGMANVVFLTPGFRHPSYFEHAYKARLLGFPLVEPADLTVRERRLFLKTLAGLRLIDGVACRVDDADVDPLQDWSSDGGGVPGMIEAWRTGNVALANAPGAGFAASLALMPFLPGICRKWFGEEIKLPFVETWWLSQAAVRRRVLDRLDRYVLLSAFNRDPALPIRCATLSAAARKKWMAIIEERPYDFVAQLDVASSEAPSLETQGICQRPVVWRAYAVNAAQGAVVLPGGLARVGKASQAPQLWPLHAGITKDVWVSDGAVEFKSKAEDEAPRVSRARHPSALEVPSRVAEQLFWVGRYAERIELAARLLRVTLGNLSGESGRLQQEQLVACLILMRGCNLLGQHDGAQTLQALTGLIHDPTVVGGIANLTRSLLLNAAAARDRLSDDTWRFFDRLEGIVQEHEEIPRSSELLRTLDTLVLHLSAFAGMQAENMTRGHGWRFLEVGRRIERAMSGLKLLHAAAKQGEGGVSLLDPLLETCDSVMTYRRRHFSRPRWAAVVDLIFFDRANPRSVAYQIGILDQEIIRFPGDPDSGLFPKIRDHLQGLVRRFENSSAPAAQELDELFAAFEVFSDMLTQHYFSHSVRRVY